MLLCRADAKITSKLRADCGHRASRSGVAIAKADFPIAIDPPVGLAPGGGWIGGGAP